MARLRIELPGKLHERDMPVTAGWRQPVKGPMTVPLGRVVAEYRAEPVEIRTFGVHAPELAERDQAELLDLPASGRIAPAVTPARDRPES